MSDPGPAFRVVSPAFADGGPLPPDCTGRGADRSPELRLPGLSSAAASLAVVMDDLDIPLRGVLNHWVIWDLPAGPVIPAAIPAGAELPSGARQGAGYGVHRYAGPKIPRFLRGTHRYRFTVYALDCRLSLPADSDKRALLRAMEGHILQSASITGTHRTA